MTNLLSAAGTTLPICSAEVGREPFESPGTFLHPDGTELVTNLSRLTVFSIKDI